jgi:hypothetical protein
MVMVLREEIRRLRPDVTLEQLDTAVKNVAAAMPRPGA